jgi:peptide/nickel transport system substrate-binding protein
MFAAVDKIETPDPHTVVIKLNQPHPALLMSLSPPLMPILPKHVYGDGQKIREHPANLKPVGSGPFKYVEMKAGEYYILERNEDYFRPGRPYLDRIIIRTIQDPKAREISLKQGKIHHLNTAGMRYKSVARLKKDKNFKLAPGFNNAFGSCVYVDFNIRKPPFNDLRVRRAMSYALDGEFVTQKLHHGLTHRATGPLHHMNPFYTADVNTYDLNLEKANQLLDEAGYPKKKDGMRFSATFDWCPGLPDDLKMVAEYMKPQMKKVGIDIQLRPSPDFGTWFKRISDWHYELTLDWPYNYPDPIIGVHRLFDSNNIRKLTWTNVKGYNNPKMDELLNKAAVEMDFEKRKAMYAEFQRMVTDEALNLYVHEVADFTLYHKDLMGWPKGTWIHLSSCDGVYWREGKSP